MDKIEKLRLAKSNFEEAQEHILKGYKLIEDLHTDGLFGAHYLLGQFAILTSGHNLEQMCRLLGDTIETERSVKDASSIINKRDED